MNFIEGFSSSPRTQIKKCEVGQETNIGWNRPRQTVAICYLRKEKRIIRNRNATPSIEEFSSSPRTQIKTCEAGQETNLGWNRPRKIVVVCHSRVEKQQDYQKRDAFHLRIIMKSTYAI
jgi:hypothetical protein